MSSRLAEPKTIALAAPVLTALAEPEPIAFAVSSTGTNGNVFSTDAFTKAAGALVCYIDLESEEM